PRPEGTRPAREPRRRCHGGEAAIDCRCDSPGGGPTTPTRGLEKVSLKPPEPVHPTSIILIGQGLEGIPKLGHALEPLGWIALDGLEQEFGGLVIQVRLEIARIPA